MPDGGIKLPLGIDTSGVTKDVQKLIGEIQKEASKTIKFGKVDASTVNSALDNYLARQRAINERMKAIMQSQEAVFKARKLEIDDKEIKTLASEMEQLKKLSSQALHFDDSGKVKQLTSELEQMYSTLKNSDTARQAEVKEQETLLRIEQERVRLAETQQKLAYAQAELPKAQEKLAKVEAIKGKDSTAYNNASNAIQVLTANIERYSMDSKKSEAIIESLTSKVSVLRNIQEISPKFDTKSIDSAEVKASGIIEKMQELKDTATQVIDNVETFEIIDDGFTNTAEAIENANEALKEYNALLERRPQEAIDDYTTGREEDREGFLVSRDVGSDIEELKAQLQSAEPDFARIQELTERLEPALADLGEGANKLDYLKAQAEQAANAEEKLVEQTAEVASVSGDIGSSLESGLDGANQAINDTSEGMQALVASAEETKSELGDISIGSGNEEFKGNIADMVSELSTLQKKLQELVQKKQDVLSGKTSVSDSEWVQLNSDIESTVNQLNKVRQKIEDFGHASERVRDEVGSALGSVSGFVSTMNSKILSGIKSMVSGFKSMASTIRNNLVGALKKMKSSFDKAFSTKNMKRNLTTLLKYTLGVRSLYFAFRKLRAAVKEGIDNLVQFQSETNETNAQMTEFKTSLLFLKNAWGAAFAPIINVVMPILTSLIDMLANVANAIARFFAALTGQSTVIQALKVGVGDYAKSLSGAGGSAKKAADEQKKLNDRLAAFDDLNVLGKDKDDEDKSPSGGGGGVSTPSVNEMFERIDTPLNQLADMLRRAWETGDAFDVGKYIGENLKQSLIDLNTWLLTEGRAKILKIGNLIGTFIDGFISVDKLAHVIGSTLGNAIALGIDFVNTIVTPDRFYRIGQFIVEGVNAFIPKVVPKLGELFGNLLHSGISMAYGFITDADFKGWGTSIGQSINNFFTQMAQENKETGMTGWEELGASLTEGAIGLMDMLIAAINEIDPKQITEAIRQFLDKIDWEAIKAKFKELWDTVWEFLGEAFPEDEFGIDFGNLKTDIENFASLITDIIKNIPWGTIKDILLGILEFISGLDVNKVEKIGKGFLILVGALELIGGVANILSTLGMITTFFNAIGGSAIFSSIGGILSEIGGFFTDLLPILPEILSVFVALMGVVVSVREAIESFKEGGGFSALFDFFGEGLEEDGIAGLGKKLGELLLGAVGTALDDFRAGVDGLINSDNPLQVLWASFMNDDDFLTSWADDLVSSGKDWETWAGGLISSAEGVLGVISDLSNVSMTDVLTGIWGKLSERPIDTILEGLDEWDGTKIDDALMKLGEYFTVGFDAIFGDGSSVQTSALDAWSGVFNFDSTEISAGLTTFIEDTVARFEDFKTRSADKAEEFKSVVGEKFATFRDNFGSIVDNIKERLDGWKANFSDGITFIKDTASSFKDSFMEGFTTFKDFLIDGLQVIKDALDFSETLNGLGEVFRGAFNSVVDVINSFLSVLAQGINGIGDLIGDLEFDNPITGTHYSLNIPTVNAIQIPHLAQGAVIPPNREFMAVLGDQTSGTNIEAPLDTIRQAVGDELAPYLEQLIAINNQVVQAINNKNLTIGDREIGKANARYVQQQKMMKGSML